MTNISAPCNKSSISGYPEHKRTAIKKASCSRSKQFGFFDLGISLVILALSGGAVYITEHAIIERNATLQEESSNIATIGQTGSTNEDMATLESGIPGIAMN